MAKLSVAIVGAGASGSRLMLPPLKAMADRVDVVAICDPNFEAARQVADANGVPEACDSLAGLLERRSVDAVCISTPPTTHFELAKLAMESGAAVVVEKPFTDTIEEAHELRRIHERTGAKLTVVHNHKFRPGMVQAKALFEAGVTGPLLHVQAEWISSVDNRMMADPDCWVHRVKGGAFKEVLPHILYNTYQFVGDMKPVDIRLRKIGAGRDWMPFDEGLMSLEGAQCPVTLHVSFNGEYDNTDVPRSSWTLQGSKGLMYANYYKSFVPNVTRRHAIKEGLDAALSGLRKNLTMHRGRRLTYHGQVIARFIDHLQTGETPPVSWDEAIHVMELTDLITGEIEARKSSRAAAQPVS